jgi:hypothetical protein
LDTGVEVSPIESLEGKMVPTGHVGCLPRPGDPFAGRAEAIVDRPPGSVKGGVGVEWCHAMGGFAVVNHPFVVTAWVAYDWTSLAYDAIEVYNGGARFEQGDARAFDAWLCDVSQGRATVPVGASDAHEAAAPAPGEPDADLLNPALGWPTTRVRGTDALASLGDGRVVVAEPGTSLELKARAGSAVVGPGEALVPLPGRPIDLWLSASAVEPDLRVELLVVDRSSCVQDTRALDGAVPQVEPDTLLSERLDGAFEETFTFEAEGGQALVARVWPDGEIPGVEGAGGVAIAAPVRIDVW